MADELCAEVNVGREHPVSPKGQKGTSQGGIPEQCYEAQTIQHLATPVCGSSGARSIGNGLPSSGGM